MNKIISQGWAKPLNSVAIVLILIFQAAILYLFLNPINLLNQLSTVQVINDVTKLVSENKDGGQVPPNELPQVGVIGDGKNLKNIDELKKGNAIDAEIYKDAQNGDYVVGYTSKLVIYRPSEKKVIYNGETPQQKLNQNQQAQQQVIVTVSKAALDAKLITEQTPVPQASVVTDAEKVKAGNAFYSVVQNNDIIATYSNPDLIVIYRPSEQKIVKSGKIEIAIK
jgi:hypothetical protein